MTSWGAILPANGLAWESDALTIHAATALEPAWSDLALNAAEKNIFSFPWYIIPSLPLLAKLNPQVVTIYHGGLLIGLLVVRGDLGYAKLPVPFWRTALHYEQYLGTPLVRAGFEDRFAAGLCGWLDTARADHCFIALTLMTGEGMIADAIAAHCAAEKRPRMALNRFQRAAIALDPHSQNAPADPVGSGRRKSLRRAMQGLAAQGEVRIERLALEADIAVWLEDFLNLENTGWKRDNGSSILACPMETALYRQMVASAFERGSLNFFRLCVAGKPIAYTLDIAAAPHVYCLKSAFDQAFKKHSPGVIMEYETLKYYRQQTGFTQVDSCTAPDNGLLNELWPDRKSIVDMMICRKGAGYKALFAVIKRIKSRMINAGADHAR